MTKRKSSMPEPINPNNFVSEKFKKKRDELQDLLWKKIEENKGKEPPIDHIFGVTMHAYHALQSYRTNPELFNVYPEEYSINEAKLLLEFFCICVNTKQEIPDELNEYLRDSFEKILQGNLSIERCLNLVGRTEKNPYLAPTYLKDITNDIMNKGYTLIDSCREKSSKTGKNYKTLMQHFNEYSETLLYEWFLMQEIKGKKIKYDDLKVTQKNAIKKYFDNHVHDKYK
jgi:hypothetical protein